MPKPEKAPPCRSHRPTRLPCDTHADRSPSPSPNTAYTTTCKRSCFEPSQAGKSRHHRCRKVQLAALVAPSNCPWLSDQSESKRPQIDQAREPNRHALHSRNSVASSLILMQLCFLLILMNFFAFPGATSQAHFATQNHPGAVYTSNAHGHCKTNPSFSPQCCSMSLHSWKYTRIFVIWQH